jgi:hypothetical protein
MDTSTLPAKISLPAKGQTANLNSVKALKATLKWTTGEDFDLAAIAVNKAKQCVFINFSNKGDLNVFPFVKLDKDAGVGDKVDNGGNEENMIIAKVDDEIEAIFLVSWDYGAAQNNKPARFTNNLKIGITAANETGADNLEVELVAPGNDANGVVIAALVRNTLGGIEFKNMSEGFKLGATGMDGASILTAIGFPGATNK